MSSVAVSKANAGYAVAKLILLRTSWYGRVT